MHCFPDFGDSIGMESCVEFKSGSEVEMAPTGGGREAIGLDVPCRRRTRKWREMMEREFPPPIPWLEQAENVVSSSMLMAPWAMRKYCTRDGRVIIKEERVRHDYLQALRCDGRLVLNLVPFDDHVVERKCGEVVRSDGEEEEEEEKVAGEEVGGGDEDNGRAAAVETFAECQKFDRIGVSS